MKKTLKVKLTFTEELLGTASANPDLHAEFIASKAPDAKTTMRIAKAKQVRALQCNGEAGPSRATARGRMAASSKAMAQLSTELQRQSRTA